MESVIVKQKIKNIAKQIFPELVEIRRHIHKYPELSFLEFETVRHIKNIFDKYCIEYDDSFGENSLIGIINGADKGKTIGLRADLDALKISEKNEVEYKSVNSGVMHACGHDVHTASLIGTAIVLNKIKEHLSGRFIFIFQPGEETDPGGAKILIENGLLEKYKIDKILGQHVLPNLETGYFGFTPGKSMAATNELYISFTGKGGHAAIPEQRSDTVLALSTFINKVKELPEKFATVEEPVIVAFGKIIADGSINVVPSKSEAEGTMRTFNENVRQEIKNTIIKIANESAHLYKCTADIEIKMGYPFLENDIELTNEAIKYAKEFLSPEQIVIADKRMTGEDFAYFAQKIHATYYRMGISGNGKGKTNLHNEYFDIDEKSLEYSAALMAFLAYELSK